jgi:predicted metal-dependent hydrolase
VAPPPSAVTESSRQVRLTDRSLDYVLRTSPRVRAARITIDDRRGVVVSIPPGTRRGWGRPEGRVERLLRERAGWIVRHVDRLARERAEVATLGGVRDGGAILYRGEVHRIRIEPAPLGSRRSSVQRVGGETEDELVIRRAARDRREGAAVLEAWLRERAAADIERAIATHAPGLGVAPSAVTLRDPRTRWGSASRNGRLMLSWRLVMAPPASLETVVVHELAHLRVPGHGAAFWALVESRRPSHRPDRAWLRRHSHLLHGSPPSYAHISRPGSDSATVPA